MEELYLLLNERISQIEELAIQITGIFNYFKGKYGDSGSYSPTKYLEIQDFSRLINQIKKSEKVRVIKEDELVDMMYSLKTFDLVQRQRFQEISFDIMKRMYKDFQYKKLNSAAESRDIASLYLNFFTFMEMKNKVEDLKRVYVDNKIRGLPIISVLMKWLIEVARDFYKSGLKEIMQEYESLSVIGNQKGDKLSLKIMSPKTGRLLSLLKEQKNSEIDEIDKSLQDSSSFQDMLNFTNLKVPLKTQPESIDNNISRNMSMDTFTISTVPIHNRQSPHGFSNSNAVNMSLKLDPLPQIYKKKNSVIQVYVNITSAFSIRNFDPIEDLDPSCAPFLNQLIGVSKDVKKLKGKNLVAVDTDKKKDAIGQIYRNLYSRNSDVERTISNYQNKVCQKKKIRISTHAKKGELILEDITVEYFERFYLALRGISTHTFKQKTDPNMKIPEEANNHEEPTEDPNRPSKITFMRRARSNESLSPIRILHGVQDNSLETPKSPSQNKFREEGINNEEGRNNVVKFHINSDTAGILPSNQFRILKVTNSFQKLSKENSKQEKFYVDQSFANPINLESIDRCFTKPYQTNPDGSLSPLAVKRLAKNMGPYLKKLISEEDELLNERNSSLPLYKIKAANLIGQSELSKNLSMDQSNKLIVKDNKPQSDSVDVKDFKFSEFVKTKKKELKGNDIKLDLDFFTKTLNLQRNESLDTEFKESKDSTKQSFDSALKNYLSFDTKGFQKKKKELKLESLKSENEEKRKGNRRQKLLHSSNGYLTMNFRTSYD